jgi:hypothetical protein
VTRCHDSVVTNIASIYGRCRYDVAVAMRHQPVVPLIHPFMVEVGRTWYEPMVQMMPPFMINGKNDSDSRRVTFSLKDCAMVALIKIRASRIPRL